jgi:hypothetical protein
MGAGGSHTGAKRPGRHLRCDSRTSIYNRHFDSVFTDECRHMIDKISLAFLRSYVAIGHCKLCQRTHGYRVCCLLSCCDLNFNLSNNKCNLYITRCHKAVAWRQFLGRLAFLACKSENIISLCYEDEETISARLDEEQRKFTGLQKIQKNNFRNIWCQEGTLLSQVVSLVSAYKTRPE